jgi:redox-sensitive bicupin YhaK (pirin superfamily)
MSKQLTEDADSRRILRHDCSPESENEEAANVESWDINSLGVEPHKPQVLRSDDHGRVIALTLPAGEELQEHQTHEGAYLMVMEGEIEIVQDGQVDTAGGPGFLAHFQPAERREVRAGKETKLVLILAPWPAAEHHT